MDLSTGLDTTSCPSWSMDYILNTTSEWLGPYINGVGFNINGGSTMYFKAGDTDVDDTAFLKSFETTTKRVSTMSKWTYIIN